MMNITKQDQHVKGILSFFALLFGLIFSGSSLADEPEASATAAEFAGVGAKGCLTCHGENSANPAHEILMTSMALTADVRTPFGAGNHQCETCHGPSRSHLFPGPDGTRPAPGFLFNNETPTAEKNAVCLGCHAAGQRTHWRGSTHDTAEDVGCVDCHSSHKLKDPVLATETQPEVCFSCHKDKRASFLRQSRHPVQASTAAASNTGLMTCTDCHNPMGSTGPSNLKRKTVNETCYDCHAEKRGPFLWEHAPAREDCTNCHNPHGTNHPDMLVARQPWLCQQCHAANFHPSSVYSGTGLPANGRADQRILGKQCLNCHQQIHGSNHPSGARLTR
jgi:DmsE family decaheme c-type cytochrome